MKLFNTKISESKSRNLIVYIYIYVRIYLHSTFLTLPLLIIDRLYRHVYRSNDRIMPLKVVVSTPGTLTFMPLKPYCTDIVRRLVSQWREVRLSLTSALQKQGPSGVGISSTLAVKARQPGNHGQNRAVHRKCSMGHTSALFTVPRECGISTFNGL